VAGPAAAGVVVAAAVAAVAAGFAPARGGSASARPAGTASPISRVRRVLT
jgi:hypothetical protein